MDYVFGLIDDAADSIETYRKEVAGRQTEDFEPADEFKRLHKNFPCFESAERLKEEVLQELDYAIHALRVASTYARNVEWLQSGDYGYESFIFKLCNERDSLRESEKKRLEATWVPDLFRTCKLRKC